LGACCAIGETEAQRGEMKSRRVGHCQWNYFLFLVGEALRSADTNAQREQARANHGVRRARRSGSSGVFCATVGECGDGCSDGAGDGEFVVTSTEGLPLPTVENDPEAKPVSDGD
jgi:hypothetical protein